MVAERIDEYHKNGCNFSGKLVVIRYLDDAQSDKRWGTFGAGICLDYLFEARSLVKERGYNVVRELLSIPDLVLEIE